MVEQDLAQIAAARLPFSKLAGKSVLVTGAAGFLPAYVVETLLYLNERRGLGIRVIGLVRRMANARRRFAHYRGRRDLRLIAGNAARPPRLPGPVSFILHAASQASPKFFGPDPIGTLAPNVLGTAALLELARRKKAAFLFFSSSDVYGQATARRLREEQAGIVDPLDPRSCYAEAKRMGETLCASWHRQHGVRAVIARFFHTYGPGMALDDGRVFSDFVADVVAGRDLVVRGDGKAVRSYCYLADAAAGCFATLLKGEPGCAYNVGNDRTVTDVWGLAQRLARLFPQKRLSVVRSPRCRGSSYQVTPYHRFCPDVSRLRALGWTPRHGLDSGFRRTVEFYS